MMKKIVLAVLVLWGTLLHAQVQPYQSAVFPNQPVKVGQQTRVIYNSKGGDLEFSDEVKVALYTFQKGFWKVESFDMKAVGDKQWELSYLLKDSIFFIAARFFQGDLDEPDMADNNANKGYGTPVVDTKGQPQQGAYLAEASFLIPTLAKGALLNYYEGEPVLQKEYLAQLIKKEEKLSGAAINNNFAMYLGAQRVLLDDTQFAAVATKLVDQLVKDKAFTDEPLGRLQLFLKHQVKEDALAERVGQYITAQYPNSATARFVAYSNIRTSGSLQEVIPSYEDFLQRYPISEWRKKPDSKGFIYYAVYRGIGSSYFDDKQFDKFQALFKDLDFRTANELLRWNVMRAYMFKMVSKDSLYEVAEPLIQDLLTKKQDNSYKSDFMSTEAADSNMWKQVDERLFTHISLLNDLGRYEQARKYFFELSEEGKYANAELNEINLNVLEKLGANNEVVPFLEMCVRANAVTPQMFDTLKASFRKGHGGSDAGYEAYLASLKSSEEKAELEAYVNEHLNFNYQMPVFSLENADGGHITPNDLKDKIVVMDFWATWCRPCIMAFPGMQLLVDKYANDKQVDIYMVGTMQTGDYRAKSVNFARGEGYRFTLLHDAENAKNGAQDVLFKSLVGPVFSDSSIPRKIVIKNGVIRYSSGGYSGSPSKLMDELSLVIEKLRSE